MFASVFCIKVLFQSRKPGTSFSTLTQLFSFLSSQTHFQWLTFSSSCQSPSAAASNLLSHVVPHQQYIQGWLVFFSSECVTGTEQHHSSLITAKPGTQTHCPACWPPSLFSFPSTKLRRAAEWMVHWCAQPANSIKITIIGQTHPFQCGSSQWIVLQLLWLPCFLSLPCFGSVCLSLWIDAAGKKHTMFSSSGGEAEV